MNMTVSLAKPFGSDQKADTSVDASGSQPPADDFSSFLVVPALPTVPPSATPSQQRAETSGFEPSGEASENGRPLSLVSSGHEPIKAESLYLPYKPGSAGVAVPETLDASDALPPIAVRDYAGDPINSTANGGEEISRTQVVGSTPALTNEISIVPGSEEFQTPAYSLQTGPLYVPASQDTGIAQPVRISLGGSIANLIKAFKNASVSGGPSPENKASGEVLSDPSGPEADTATGAVGEVPAIQGQGSAAVFTDSGSSSSGGAAAELPNLLEMIRTSDSEGNAAIVESGIVGAPASLTTLADGTSDQFEMKLPAHMGREVTAQFETKLIALARLAEPEKQRILKMRLSPAELGSVEITLVKHHGGGLSAHINTETAAAHSALNEDLSQLRQSLESAGLTVDSLEIGCSPFSNEDQGGTQHRELLNEATRSPGPASSNEDSAAASGNGDVNRLVSLRA